MRRTAIGGLAAAVVFAIAGIRADAAQGTQFIGTTPCGEAVRRFVGGLEESAQCHAMTWRLTLESNRWSLAATYGIPPAHNPNAMVDGPTVHLDGALTKTSDGLQISREGRALTFRRVSDAVIHFTSADALMVGTAGWSYTLSRSDIAEKPVDPSMAPDVSYQISSRASGHSVFGIFEGRTPCTGIATAIKARLVPGCLKVKWRVTLLQDPSTGQPGRYKVEGSLHRAGAREGTWRIERGRGSDPRAVVYRLDAVGSESPLLLLRGDDNVLFFLNEHRQMLVGNLDFGYTLNRYSDR